MAKKVDKPKEVKAKPPAVLVRCPECQAVQDDPKKGICQVCRTVL